MPHPDPYHSTATAATASATGSNASNYLPHDKNNNNYTNSNGKNSNHFPPFPPSVRHPHPPQQQPQYYPQHVPPPHHPHSYPPTPYGPSNASQNPNTIHTTSPSRFLPPSQQYPPPSNMTMMMEDPYGPPPPPHIPSQPYHSSARVPAPNSSSTPSIACAACHRSGLNLFVCDDSQGEYGGGGNGKKGRYCSYCMIGRKVRVFWPLDEQWYVGIVQEYDESNGEHLLRYPDGDTEWVKIGENSPPISSPNHMTSNTASATGAGAGATTNSSNSTVTTTNTTQHNRHLQNPSPTHPYHPQQHPLENHPHSYHPPYPPHVYSTHPSQQPQPQPQPHNAMADPISITNEKGYNPQRFGMNSSDTKKGMSTSPIPLPYGGGDIRPHHLPTYPHSHAHSHSALFHPHSHGMSHYGSPPVPTYHPPYSHPANFHPSSHPFPIHPHHQQQSQQSQNYPYPSFGPTHAPSNHYPHSQRPPQSNLDGHATSIGTEGMGGVGNQTAMNHNMNHMHNNNNSQTSHTNTSHPPSQSVGSMVPFHSYSMKNNGNAGKSNHFHMNTSHPMMKNMHDSSMSSTATATTTTTPPTTEMFRNHPSLPLHSASMTNTQLYYDSNSSNKRKSGPKSWTKEEDTLLLSTVRNMRKPMKWSVVAQALRDRTGKQCRERYVNHLNPRLKSSDWHPCEDATIFTLYNSLGTQWAKMAKMIPGRTDNGIKNRFHNLRRQLEREDDHRNRLSKPAEFPDEIHLERLRTFPSVLQGKNDELWNMSQSIGVIAAQSVIAMSNSNSNATSTNSNNEDDNLSGSARTFGKFGPFRDAKHTGEQCARCGLFAPSVHCGSMICTRSRWCQTCTRVPPHLSGNLLRELLNLRRCQDVHKREIIEGWDESNAQ